MDEVIFQNKPNLYAFCLFVLLCGFKKKINQMRFSKGYIFKQNYTFSLFLKKNTRFSMVFTEEMKIPPI